PGENWGDDPDVGDVEYVHSATFQYAHGGRLIVGLPSGDTGIFSALVSTLTPPYILLYVLHTDRGQGETGRYDSPELSAGQFDDFINAYGPYLTGDGRFDLWARSHADDATIVWDRHNLIHAYGPVDRFRAILDAHGFSEGEVSAMGPHVHHYRPELDGYAQAILGEYQWRYTPLRPEDEQ
ncbi:MAG: hypothetical protein JF571_04195, partial [Asticcacaulis sp.]|nr:hypothetical protein [Asticcacaulis sp.]